MTHEFEPVADTEDNDGGLSLRQKINLVLAALLGAALVIFIVQNTESQSVSWLSFEINLAMWIIVLGSAAIGALLSTMARMLLRRRRS